MTASRDEHSSQFVLSCYRGAAWHVWALWRTPSALQSSPHQTSSYHRPTDIPATAPAGFSPLHVATVSRDSQAGPRGCPELTRDGEGGEAGGEGLPHGLELLLQGQGLPLLLRQLLLQLLLGAVHALRVLLQDGVLLLELRVHLPQAPQLGLPGCRGQRGSKRVRGRTVTPSNTPNSAPSSTFVLVQELFGEDGHVEGGEGVAALASLEDRRGRG